MTVPGAVEVIRELAKSSPADVLVGAGTVLNAEAARRCLDAGAQFLVSPGLNLQVIHLAVAEGKLMMAGALTPTEVIDRKSTRLNSSHVSISYAVFCLKKKK